MGSRGDEQIPVRVVTHTRNPAQRAFHTLASVLGWVLFAYFWYKIFVQSFDRQAAVTIILILLVLGGIILVNFLWVHFNRGLYKRLGRRKRIRESDMTPTADKLGRPLLGADWPLLKASSRLLIGIDGSTKIYRQYTPTGYSPGYDPNGTGHD